MKDQIRAGGLFGTAAGLLLVSIYVVLGSNISAAIVVGTAILLVLAGVAFFSPRSADSSARRPGPGLVFLTGWAATIFTAEAGTSSGDAAATFSPQKIVPLAILAVGILQLLAKASEGDRRVNWVPVGTFGAYLIWQAISVLAAADLAFSAMRVLQAALPFVGIVALLRARVAPNLVIWATLVPCLIHVIYALANPSYIGFTGEQRLVGLLIANAFALASSLVIVISIGLWQAYAIPRPFFWLPIPMVTMAAYAIYLSIGRTASLAVPAALLIGALISGGRSSRLGSQGAGARRLVAATGGVAVVGFALTNRAQFSGWFSTGNQSLDTLTGRTEVWSGIRAAVHESPLLGYGPGAMRSGSPELRLYLGNLLDLGQAHNSVMEALANSGYVGAALWLAAMLALAIAIVRTRTPLRPVAAPLFVAVCFFSITLGNFAGFGIGWYALMLCLLLGAQPSETSEGEPRSDKEAGMAAKSQNLSDSSAANVLLR